MEIEIKSVADLQTAFTAMKQDLGQSVTALDKKIDVTVDAFDKLQISLKQENRRTPNGSGSTMNVASFIQSGLENSFDDIAKFVRRETKGFVFETKAVGDMSLGNYTGGTSATNSQTLPGVQGMPAEILNIRDLLRKTTMTGSTLPVLVDNGGEGSFAPVAEGALKPQVDYDLSEVPFKAEVIAGWVNITKQALDDIPNAITWLTQKLTNSYLTVENNMLLNGTGVSPQIKGLHATGNFTAATSLAIDNDVEQLVKGIIQLRTLNRMPTGIVIHPSNFETLLLNQAAGSGEFDLPSYVTVSNGGSIAILGVPVVSTTAQTINQYTILDNSGMIMAIREGLRIEMFEQDGDNVQKNRITVRAESRFALGVYGSTYVVKGSFA